MWRGKGLKLHIQCGGNNKLIEAVSVTQSNVTDISEAKKFTIEAGRVYVFDKGYLDFNWWHKIDKGNSYFVTRIKRNTAYQIIERRNVERCSEMVINDNIIVLSNKTPRGGKINMLSGKPLRLVEIYDEEHNKRYQFISNLLEASADEIARYYKQRWGIELLFKWLKQNLKMTTFLSENENAIKTQIYVAIITYVLLGMFKKLCTGAFSRAIDLLSWLKISIFSNHTPLKPPLKNRTNTNSQQLSFNAFL
jgi:putative transposase